MTITDQLAGIDLADTTHGGIRARVEEAADLIHTDIEDAHAGRRADLVPLTPSENRSAAA